VHRSAHGAQDGRESILVGWHSGAGEVGWSECPTLSGPGYVTETTEAAWAALSQQLVPAALAGRSPAITGTPAASAALIDAALDAALRAAGTPLGAHLAALQGCELRTEVPWCAVLAEVGAPAEEMVDAARAAVAQGASMVKVKVAGAVTAPLEAVRGSVEVPVAVDANGSLDAAQLMAYDELGLAYIEQPLPPTATWEDWAGVRGRLSTPLALDESLPSLDAVRSALLAGALDVVSVKPARIGGCEAAASAAALAADHGASCVVGGMFELGVGRAAALSVAALEVCDLPCDLGPSARYVEPDVCEPLVTGGTGSVVVPVGAGIGRTPDPARLEVVAHLQLGA
jgi:O-succinylbenzoate synthase